MANLRFSTPKGLIISTVILFLVVHAKPAFAETTSETAIDESLQRTKAVFKPRWEQVKAAKDYVDNQENSIDDKIVEISKVTFPEGEGWETNSRLDEACISEKSKLELYHVIVTDFSDYVDKKAIPFYEFLSEKLNPGLDIFGNSRGKFQKELSNAFIKSSEIHPQLDWFALSEVGKRVAIYRVIDVLLKSLDTEIEFLEDVIAMTEPPFFLSWGPNPDKKRELAKKDIIANLKLNLHRSERETLSQVKKEVEKWFHDFEGIKVVCKGDLESLRDSGGKIEINPDSKAPVIMLCPPLSKESSHYSGGSRLLLIPPDRNERIGDNRMLFRMFLRTKMESLKRLNENFKEFHKELSSCLSREKQGREVKIADTSLDVCYYDAEKDFFSHVVPALDEDLGILREMKEAADMFDDDGVVEDLRDRVENLKKLLKTYDETKYQECPAENMISQLQKNSDIYSARSIRGYSVTKFLNSYACSLLSLLESYSAYHQAVLAGEANGVSESFQNVLDNFVRKINSVTDNSGKSPICPQIDPISPMEKQAVKVSSRTEDQAK